MRDRRTFATVSRAALTILYEYATSADEEVEERGLSDLKEVLPEIRMALKDAGNSGTRG